MIHQSPECATGLARAEVTQDQTYAPPIFTKGMGQTLQRYGPLDTLNKVCFGTLDARIVARNAELGRLIWTFKLPKQLARAS